MQFMVIYEDSVAMMKITILTMFNMLYATQHTKLLYLCYYMVFVWYSPAVKYSFQFENILNLTNKNKFSCRNELFHSKFSVSGPGEDFGEGIQSTWWWFSRLYSLMVSLFFSSLVFPTFLSSSSLTQTNSRRQGSRRRQKGSDYTSTSDEEYDSNQSTPKHKRSQPSSASHSPRNQPRHRPQPVVALHPKPRSRDSEDENREGEPLHNWSNHSTEIAR